MRSLRRSVLLAGVLTLVIAVPAWAADILIYGPSDSTESGVATTGGHTVTVADEATWTAMTTGEFAAFDAIVIGDGGCTDASPTLDAAIANRTIWSAAVTGAVVVHTFDPGAHDDGPGGNLTDELTLNSINFAASGPGTGLYFTVGCYYTSGSPTDLTILDQFGTFTVNDESSDPITIVAPAHPVMSGLTEAGLSNWGQSTHEQFLAFPVSFQVLANGENLSAVVLPVALAQAAPSVEPLPDAAMTPASADSLTSLAILVLVLVLFLSGALYAALLVRRRGVIRQR